LPASSERKIFVSKRKKALALGFPASLGKELASVEYLPSCMDVIDVSQTTGVSLDVAAKSYYKLGDIFELGWLRDELEKISPSNQWDSIAVGGIVMDLRHLQSELTIRYLMNQKNQSKDIPISTFLNREKKLCQRIEQTLKMLHAQKQMDLSNGVVISRLLTQLSRNLALESSRT
jgi:glutamate dehydrogenase